MVEKRYFTLGGCGTTSCCSVRKAEFVQGFPAGFVPQSRILHQQHGQVCLPFQPWKVKSEKNQESGRCIAAGFAPSQEGLREQLLALRPVTLQPFCSVTHCPSTPSLPQPGPYHPPRRNFLLILNLNLPSFSLKPFSLILSPHTLVSSSLLLNVAPVAAALGANTPGVCHRSKIWAHRVSPAAWDLLPHPSRAAGGKSWARKSCSFHASLIGSSISLSCCFCHFPFGTGWKLK